MFIPICKHVQAWCIFFFLKSYRTVMLATQKISILLIYVYEQNIYSSWEAL